MRKIYLLLFAVVFSCTILVQNVNGQCTGAVYNTATVGRTCTPTTVGSTYAGEYNTFTLTGAATGDVYTFSSSVATDYITLRTSTGVLITSGPSPLNYTQPATPIGVIQFHVNKNAACGTESVSRIESVVLLLPMAFTSSTTTQPLSTSVSVGSGNVQVIRLDVVTCGTSTPLNMSNINFSTGLTTSLTDISSASVYYTGTSTTFSTTTQFGATLSSPTAFFSIAGNADLQNGTNYFWLVYNSSCAATVSNLLDASCVSFDLSAANKIPTAVNPTGSRAIIAATVPSTNQPSTANVNGGSINNQVLRVDIPGTTCLGNFTDFNFTNLSSNVLDISKARVYYTTSATFSTLTQFGSDVTSPAASFTVSGSLPASTTGTNYFWLVYDIACTAPATVANIADGGITSFVSSLGGTIILGTANPVGTRTIISPVVTTSHPLTTSVLTGGIDNQIYRLDIPSTSCGNLTALNFATTGTTNVADITAARVYYTTTTTFSNAVPFGSAIANPSGIMSFVGTQSLTATTNYFWLVYDVACGATAANVIDAQLDNYVLGGSTVVPTTVAPALNRAILTYASANATTQPSTAAFTAGSINVQVLRYDMTATTCGLLNSVTFNTATTTNVTDITTARAYYTTSTTFSTATPFGSASASPNGAFTITGSQALTAAANYLWLVYDVPCTAPTAAANVVDASITSFTVGTTVFTPTTTNPVGTRTINSLASAITTTQASSASITAGTVNGQIVYMNIPATLCGNVTNVTFNTTGTTSVLDISKAKCYVTTTSTFSAAVQYGAELVSPPAGDLIFTGTQALTATNTYFWLVYDVACAATPTNVLDATVKSATIGGNVNTIVVASQAPAGTRAITAYVAGSTTQASPATINSGITSSPLIYFTVPGTVCGNLTSVSFNTTGTTNVADLLNAKCYIYTGTTTVSLNPASLFGTPILSPSGVLTFTGNQSLSAFATYYVYLTMDVTCTAPSAITNVMDAQAVDYILTNQTTSVTTTYIPNTPNPAGTRLIAALATSAIANDNLCNAVDLTANIVAIPVTEEKFGVMKTTAEPTKTCTPSNSGATLECGEISPFASANNTMSHWGTAASSTIWYKFIPTVSGKYMINSDVVAACAGTMTDTQLALWKQNGATCGWGTGNMSLLASNDDSYTSSGTTLFSKLYGCNVTLDAGSTYYISVDGYSTATGTAPLEIIKLNDLSLVTTQVPCAGGDLIVKANGGLIDISSNILTGTATSVIGFEFRIDGGVWMHNIPTLSDFDMMTFSAITAGMHTVDVRDRMGCIQSVSVTIINPNTNLAATTPGAAAICQTITAGGTPQTGYNSCALIATVAQSGSSPVSGTINTCSNLATSPSTTGSGYFSSAVPRVYSITPATAPLTSTGTITLYYNQSDFDAYNAATGVNSFPSSPIGSTISICIYQRHDNGVMELIPNSSLTIAWNATTMHWEVTFPVTGFSDFYCVDCSISLPILLENFSATKQGNTAAINWQVGANNTTATYEVLKSTDGRNFTTMATQNAIVGTRNYNTTDANLAHGANYYKLKVTDRSGAITYSAVAVVYSNAKGFEIVSLIPTIVRGNALASIGSDRATNATLIVTDMQGKTMLKKVIGLQAGTTDVTIDASKFAVGAYLLRAIGSDGTSNVIRFIKQ